MAEVEDPGDIQVPTDGVIQVTGTDGKTKTYRRTARTFNDGLGFTIAEGSHEQWSFLNLAPIVHPMHIHLADFQLLGRDAYDVSGFDPAVGGTRSPIRYDAGTAIPLAPNERGYKDVFRVPGNQMLRVMGRFDGAYGRFIPLPSPRARGHGDDAALRRHARGGVEVRPRRRARWPRGGAHGLTSRQRGDPPRRVLHRGSRQCPDERVRAGAVAGQFRLEERGQEEGMAGQFGDPDVTVLVVPRESQALHAQGVEVTGGAVGAEVPFDGPFRADHRLGERTRLDPDHGFVADQ